MKQRMGTTSIFSQGRDELSVRCFAYHTSIRTN